MSETTSNVSEDKQSAAYLMKHANANPALLEFPRDVHGFTSPLRKEILNAAGRVGGFQDKQDLLLTTLYVAVAHVKARFAKDKASREQMAAWQKELADANGAAHTYSNS